MDKLSKTILEEYKEKRPIYEEFCISVYQLINSLLKNKGYKYQFFYRVKELDRLEEKLIRKKAEGKTYKKLNEIEDLAGLRVIFYLQRDEDRFIDDIRKEISGDLKIEKKLKKNGYEATHVIIRFGKQRLKLVEYEKYKDLKCELQITSSLHHAWSEIEHDIIYKDINKIKKNDPIKYNLIRRKLNKILNDHINKAASEFDKIFNQIREKF